MNHSTSQYWPRVLTLTLLGLAALLGGIWLYVRQQPATQTKVSQTQVTPSVVTPPGAPPEVASNFSGTDHNGRPFAFASTKGKVTALFFGFTHCPDTCPLTLSYLEKARQELPADLRDDVQVVFVTLDPDRDTPERLKEYVSFFGDSITGVFVPEPALKSVANAYGILYSKGEEDGKNGYEIYHSSSTLLLGKDGQPRMMYSKIPKVDQLVGDFREALRE